MVGDCRQRKVWVDKYQPKKTIQWVNPNRKKVNVGKYVPTGMVGRKNQQKYLGCVESLQSHCIHTQFHESRGPPFASHHEGLRSILKGVLL